MRKFLIKDLFDIKKGRKEKENNDVGVRYIQIEDIRNDNNLKLCEEHEKNILVNNNDLVIAWDGANAGTVGFNVSGALGSTLGRLRLKESMDPNSVNTHYIGYYLKSKENYLKENTTGATIPHVSRNVLESIEVSLPSINIQNKIVEILNRLVETKLLRQQQIEALSALKESIFLDMFGDPNINANNYETKRIDELCISIIGGGTPSKKNPEYYIGNIPWVTPKDMKREHINYTTDYINEEAIANSSAKLVPKNSLLIVIRSGILKHTLPVAINTKDVTINQDMKAFVIDESQVTTDYLFYYFKAMERSLLSKVRSVTAHNLNFNELKKLEAPIPDIHRQREFSRKINNINKSLEKINEQRINFELLYDSLIHKAFNGELFKEGMKV
ncbi:restriction endonuclease subunit S [Lederbergia sp. NSJ-179]|uniref:restriction endonuclease subunit S n=1 Tax=Lederbergia sp. NSJ-179 TaxID=2931402 RepID=UPI001FD3A25E|nr:restriction endonuclease subunit S [Lederbergia sp. NSJ-179]MCJ7843390.1 restriction endonuclease subunit S [Lederbergia sp. NSJ-179]